MGTGVIVSCFDCGYTKRFLFGVGFMHFEYNLMNNREGSILDDLISCDREVERVKNLIDDGYVIDSDYGYSLHYCKECNDYSSEFNLKYKKEEDSYQVKHFCEKCENELLNLKTQDFDLEECPQCKGDRILKSGGIMWD